MTLNKATLIGRLGKDPEVRHLNNGDRVVSFSIATSERWRDASGERKERTEWHNVVIFNDKLGEIAEQYLTKGKEVYVEGKIQTRKWEDKEGNTRYTTEIVIQKFNGEIKLLGSKDDNRDSAGRDDYAGARDGRTSVKGNVKKGGELAEKKPEKDKYGFDLDDDIPF